MKQKLSLLAVLLCAAISLTACGSVPAAKESQSSRITYTEAAMPKNTPENQEYVDKYVNPYSVTGIFSCNFGPGSMSELNGYLMTIFNALYNIDYPDAELKLTDLDTDVPEDLLENTLISHLDLTREQIREACADYYDAEKQAYTYNFGLGGGPAEFIVTDSSLDGGILSLSYDFYTGDRENTTGVFRYVMSRQGKMQIEIDGGRFKFISNTVHDVV